jgi:hypothetical protein
MGYKLRSIPRGIAALVGSAVHKGAAVELDEKARSGSLPPATVPVDAAIDLLKEDMRLGEIAYEGRGPTSTRDDALRQTGKMVASYHYSIAPSIEPIMVETRLEAEISPNVVLSGQPDLVCREPHAIRDLKTGARQPGSVAPQLGAYSLLNRSHGLDIEHAHIDFIKRVAPQQPQPDPVSTSVELIHAETAASAIIARIVFSLRIFRYGDPNHGIPPGSVWAFSANPNSQLCSARWCPAHGTEFCHEWRR